MAWLSYYAHMVNANQWFNIYITVCNVCTVLGGILNIFRDTCETKGGILYIKQMSFIM